MNYIKSLPSQLPKLRFLDRFMAGHSGYIAGGCFKGLFTGEKIKDVDLFFTSESEANEADMHFSANDEYSKAWSNERVRAYRCKKTGIVVEVIFSFFDMPIQMIDKFDFTITKACYIKNHETGEYEFHFHPRFFEHLVNRKMVIDNNIMFPLSTFNRSFRYAKYGFGLCGESKSRLIQALQGFNGAGMNDFYFGID